MALIDTGYHETLGIAGESFKCLLFNVSPHCWRILEMLTLHPIINAVIGQVGGMSGCTGIVEALESGADPSISREQHTER